MTMTVEPRSDLPTYALDDGAERSWARTSADTTPEEPTTPPASPPRARWLILAWLVVTAIGVGLVLYQVGPIVQARHQRSLLSEFRADIEAATNASFGLQGAEAPTLAPGIGSPVGVLDSSDIPLRQVVVEGAEPQQTRKGPGHVTGTAGLGQPGNSVVVGRRALFGGPFESLTSLSEGDRILVSTTQGRSAYVVGFVGGVDIVDPDSEDATGDAEVVSQYGDFSLEDDDLALDGTDDDTEAGDDSADAAEEADDALLPDGPLTVDQLQGPTDDDRLTLITSADGSLWSDGKAEVVVATMDGVPFTPTPQGGRTGEADGRTADTQALAPLVLAIVAYVATVLTAIVAYRRFPWRSAYLLTAPILVATTIVLAEQLTRTLPAWA